LGFLLKRLVGIVGKPNVGKSTFFSAATMVSVPVAAYPFTTIKPNHGVGYVRVRCVCKEIGIKDEPVNSTCIDGTRMIPIELIDCAGLVPDAWKGKGLGNKFLDEIMTADALIHVVDASGATDIEGRICPAGTHDPMEDIEFLKRELDMWMLKILKRDWDKLIRKGKISIDELIDSIADRLSGLAIKRSSIENEVRKLRIMPENISSWSEEDLITLVHNIRIVSKPMIIAANKIDIPQSIDNMSRIKESGHVSIPCSAEAELALRRSRQKKMTNYEPGNDKFNILDKEKLKPEQLQALKKISEEILFKFGSTGIQETINFAFFKMLNMITVYPVENIENFSDHKGRVLPDAYLVPYGATAKDLACMIHTEIGKGFLYATDARTKMRSTSTRG
jgi:ribosome-binding ATPase YchF (GTP1/OBG family)